MNDSINTLSTLSKIAAASFSVFISSADSHLFGIDDFTELPTTLNIESLFKQQEYQRWNQLRQMEDTRFIGLTMPKVLMRKPYNTNGVKIRHRFFKETTHQTNDYLWGNSAYLYACQLIQCFIDTSWFADINDINLSKNIRDNQLNPRIFHTADNTLLLSKPSTQTVFTENQEKRLSDAGLIALCDEPLSEIASTYSSPSLHQPQKYTTAIGSINANLSSMINYVLCCARFSHYIKIIMRDKVGSFLNENDCENFLRRWINQYCAASDSISAADRAKYPLKEANISITSQQNNPGQYHCTIHLKPHFQIDSIHSQLKLTTNIKLESSRTRYESV